jgi:diadenylate cyclase
VFERKTGVSELIESGIAMESRITSELLINIFTPNSPLHDGAVIIRGNQIMAAGCYLPLSENPFISKELGTRHRAAIGVSEVSDALSVVVSEETGQVSLSINGMIVRDINEESLISKLFDELTPKASGKEKGLLASLWKRKGD